MPTFTTIDLDALNTVNGGQQAPTPEAPNTTNNRANANIGVTYRGTQVGVQGEVAQSTTRSNAAQCAQDVRAAGGTAADVRACYGLPAITPPSAQ